MNTLKRPRRPHSLYGAATLAALLTFGLPDGTDADPPTEPAARSSGETISADTSQTKEQNLRPHIIIAEHVLLWDTKVVTWEEILDQFREIREHGPLQPTLHGTNGLIAKEQHGWPYWQEEVFKVYSELFEPAGVTYSILSPRGSRRYDRIRTADDLKPDPALARSGRVWTPNGELAEGAQAVVLPTEDALGVVLSGKRLRDPLNETWVSTDEAGRFTIYPEDATYVLAVLHESGVSLQTLNQRDEGLDVKLDPWATITFSFTGDLTSISVRPRGMREEGPRFDVYEVKTDREPVIVPVPAGTITVRRTLEMEDGSSIGLPVAEFDLASGENQELKVSPATIADELRAFELHRELQRRRGR